MAFSWKSLLGQVAPILGTAIGGPIGGMALKAVSSAILGHPNGSEDDIAAAMANATPEQLLALKQADNDFKAKMAELGIRPEELDVQDRDSARKMAIARGFLPQIVITGIVLTLYAVLFAVIAGGYAQTPPQYTEMIKGAFEGFWPILTLILNFWFGSSHGSQKKDMLNSK